MSDEKCPKCGSHEPHLKGSLCCLERQLAAMTQRAEKAEADLAEMTRPYVEPMLNRFEDGTFTFTVDKRAVSFLVEAFGPMLGNAPNWASVEVFHPTLGRLIVSVQKATGDTPIETVGKLRVELARVKAAEAVLAAIDRLVSEKATKIEAELHRDCQTCVTVRRWWRDRNGVCEPREFTGPTLADCLAQAEKAVAAEKPATGGGEINSVNCGEITGQTLGGR